MFCNKLVRIYRKINKLPCFSLSIILPCQSLFFHVFYEYGQELSNIGQSTPAVCLIRRTEIEMCRNCKALISRTLAAEYTHMHK